jgi:hypothetical protein
MENLLDEKRSLEQSIKSSQVQHEISYEESDKMQNVHMQEISNLRQQVIFREQESIDQQNKSKQDQEHIQSLKNEISRLQQIEPIYENIKVSLSLSRIVWKFCKALHKIYS